MAKEKCYPVPFGNVTICDNNKNGQCKLWNKKCDNIQKKKENSLADWSDAIKTSAEQAAERKKKWQMEMGEPDQIYQIEEYKFGFWKIEIGVLVAPIYKNGADPTRMQIYEREFIEMLVKTLEK